MKLLYRTTTSILSLIIISNISLGAGSLSKSIKNKFNNKKALVIGINDYMHSPLEAAVSDAKGVGLWLK